MSLSILLSWVRHGSRDMLMPEPIQACACHSGPAVCGCRARQSYARPELYLARRWSMRKRRSVYLENRSPNTMELERQVVDGEGAHAIVLD